MSDRRTRTRTVTLAVAILSMTTVAAALVPQQQGPYWPRWRGPEMTGVAPDADPPTRWSEQENVAWKVEIPGRGSGTPVIWKDRIFVLTAVPAETTPVETASGETDATPIAASAPATFSAEPAASRAEPAQRRQRRRGRRGAREPQRTHRFKVLAVARTDGRVLWKRTAAELVPHEGVQPNNTFASASAITDGEHVWAYFGSRGLYCYDLEGNLVWERDLGDMRTRLGFGEGSSPALHGDRLVVTWDHEGESFIVALDKATGEEIWRRERDEPTTWATPLVVDNGGPAQVVTAGTNRIRGYDLETGELLWQGPGLTPNSIPSPVYADGVAYLTAGYRGSALRAVRLAAAEGAIGGTDALLWTHDRDTPYVPSPLLYGDILYFTKSNNAILTAVDATTGAPHYGPLRLEGLAEIYASPVGAAGRVYIVGRDGNALVLAHGPSFEVLARNALDDGFDASPAVVDGELYLRGYRHLYRISR